MKSSIAIILPVTPSATTDTGRIRFGAGWRLPPAR
jgi:hypothetical protein